MVLTTLLLRNSLLAGIIEQSSYVCFRFNQILCQRSFAHLRAVFDEYAKISSKTVEDAIKSEFSGDIKNGLLTVGERLTLGFQFSLACFA